MKFLGERTPLLKKKVFYKVTAIYAVVAGMWILLSDRILLWYFEDPAKLTRVQTVKGWFFVLATAAMLACLVRHYIRQLERERDLLENFISNIPLCVYWQDRKGRLLGCNQRYASVAGGGRKEYIVGETDHDPVWRKAEAELIRQRDRAVMEKREPLLDVEETRVQADGHQATFLTSRVPLEDESGHIIGMLVICADITSRKLAEKALRESEERFRSFFESAAAPMGIIAPDGTLLQVNQATCRFFGYTEEELLSLSIDDLTHLDDQKKTKRCSRRSRAASSSLLIMKNAICSRMAPRHGGIPRWLLLEILRGICSTLSP